jgi:predicted permease
MNTFFNDIKYALRQLRKSPGFTVVAVLSLALGIGANTAIFSMINGILYKTLPVRDPHELRVINWTCDPTHNWPDMRRREGGWGRTKSNTLYCGSFPYPAYLDFAKQAQGFSDIFAFSHTHEMTINASGVATLANGQMVSGNFFRSYGARILIGRPITPEDDRPDAPPVAVLTYPFWQRIFGLDPHVLGRTLTVGNTGFTVVGILPRNHVGPWGGQSRIDYYVPMTTQARVVGEDEKLNSNNAWWVQMMGRLIPGADEAQVQASLELLFSHVVNRSETKIDRPGILLQKGKCGVVTGRQGMAEVLWGGVLPGVGLVLLIACTNLAGLLLARGAARQHEMAVRAAMGAGRWRLIRQSLTESMILSLAGVCLGLILSIWIRTALKDYIIDSPNNQHFNLRIDMNVLLFALAAGVVTTLLSGLFPALRAGNTDPSEGLRDSGNRAAPRLRLGKLLVTTQVGLSVILVVLGGLFCRTLINFYRTDPGFDTENLLLFPIVPGKSLSPPKDGQFFLDAVCQKIAGIPGVRSVALINKTLLSGWIWKADISIPGRPETKQRDTHGLIVNDEYFATMGIKLLNGRDFRPTDTLNSGRVAIVNEEFVRLFFPNENPLLQIIMVEDKQHQIVGICTNHNCQHLRYDISPILYMPYAQNKKLSMNCMIRSALPPMSLIPAVRKAMADIDRNLPIEGITTQKLLLKKSLRYERLLASLFGSLAFLGLTLSCIGLYGLMAYNVARRTGEMGIRKALGAGSWDVAWSVLRGSLILVGIGVAIGLPIALALSRLIRAFFYGIEPHDPVTIIGASILMITVAAMAAWIPARRAAKIDPMEALRYE